MSTSYQDDGLFADKEPLMNSRTSTWIDDSQTTTINTQRSLAQSSRDRIWSFISIGRWIIDTSLLIGILVLILRQPESGPSQSVVLAKADVGGDVTGFSPRMGQSLVKFVREEKYIPESLEDFFTKAVLQAWLGLVPKGLGFVRIQEDDKKVLSNLLHKLPGYNESVYTTSVTHQMHCLYSIINSYARAKTGREPADEEWHIIHCFDYLRQSLMCAGDVALEGAQTTFPKGFQMGSDGFDAVHVCRDYSQIKSFLEEKRTDDRIWI